MQHVYFAPVAQLPFDHVPPVIGQRIRRKHIPSLIDGESQTHRISERLTAQAENRFQVPERNVHNEQQRKERYRPRWFQILSARRWLYPVSAAAEPVPVFLYAVIKTCRGSGDEALAHQRPKRRKNRRVADSPHERLPFVPALPIGLDNDPTPLLAHLEFGYGKLLGRNQFGRGNEQETAKYADHFGAECAVAVVVDSQA